MFWFLVLAAVAAVAYWKRAEIKAWWESVDL
mgnify:CR=1 FL=1